MSIGHKKERLIHHGRHRAKRARTFSSAEKAKQWAESKKLKNYHVVHMNEGLSKKFKIAVSQ